MIILTDELRQLVFRTPVLTLANGITVLRLLLLVPIYFLMRGEQGIVPIWTVLLICFGWFSDGLDGYAARHLGQVSELGKILDPVIDKIFVLVLLILLMILHDFPRWLLAVVIPRDLIILWGGLYLARRRKTVEKSNLWGKITTNLLLATVVAYLLRWTTLMPFLITSVVLMAILSTWGYARLFSRTLGESA